MAIKVVQGLVDTGLGTRGAATVSPGSSSANQASTGFSSQILLQQQAQQAAANNAQAAKALQSDAVVSFVRTHNVTSEGKKLKDSDTAKELADSIADRVRDRDGQGLAAHNGLKASEAREHFAT